MTLDALLDSATPERAQLERIPWLPDAHVQPIEELLPTLRNEARRLAERPQRPVFSLVLAGDGAAAAQVEETFLSLRVQTWAAWELGVVGAPALAERDPRVKTVDAKDELRARALDVAIEAATGDFVLFLDPGDVLHPQALGILARQVAHDPALELVYANEASLSHDGRTPSRFLSKPDLDRFTLLRHDYLGRPAALRRELLRELARRDGEALRVRHDGAHELDLWLRLTASRSLRTLHVPLFLVYVRDRAARRAAAVPPARAVLRDELARLHGPEGFVLLDPGEAGGNEGFAIRPRLPRRDAPPLLSIVVPFRDQPEVTLACLAALERQEHGLAVEVVLVDNGSAAAALEPIRAWLGTPRRATYRLVHDPGAFNFARINNTAVREHAKGELLLLLNNDVELVTPHALDALAAHLLADDRAAFVGARLLYPRATLEGHLVQHGGIDVVEGFAGSGYWAVGHPRLASELVNDERVALGVTFACAMTRRATWDALGGLDEALFPNGFGDVDLCARAVERGLVNRYLGTVHGLHHESRSRGRALEEAENVALSELHAATFARWRLRRLAYDIQPSWALRTLGPIGLPLRYRIADTLNAGLKGVLGPGHRWLKGLLDGDRSS